MSRIRLVTFDVTNTVIKVMGSVGQNYAKIARLYDVNVDPGRVDAKFPAIFKQQMQAYPNFGVNSGLTPNKWWNMVVQETFNQAGCEMNIERVAQHLYMHFSTGEGWQVLPGAVETLTKLKQQKIKVGVISNFDERLEKILMQLALRHHFDFVISSALVKVAKPEVEIFNLALRNAKVKPFEALHVGDNIVNDYDAAKKAGLEALLLRKTAKDVPDHVDTTCVISKLSDVLSFV